MDTTHPRSTPPTQPACTVAEAVANLALLGQVRGDLTTEEAATFSAYVLGSIAAYVPPTAWDNALTHGCLFVARERNARQVVAS